MSYIYIYNMKQCNLDLYKVNISIMYLFDIVVIIDTIVYLMVTNFYL